MSEMQVTDLSFILMLDDAMESDPLEDDNLDPSDVLCFSSILDNE